MGGADGLLLAGDIGGTKTILGIYSREAGARRPLAIRTYPSTKYPSLEAIVREFLATVHLEVERACFGLAGPIVGGRAQLTNLSGRRSRSRRWPRRWACDRFGC